MLLILISKNEAIKFIQNGDLTKKAEHHETYTKMCKEILTFGNIEIEKRLILPLFFWEM